MTSVYHSIVRRAIRQATNHTTDTIVLTGAAIVEMRVKYRDMQWTGSWKVDALIDDSVVTSSGDIPTDGKFTDTKEMNACIDDLRLKYKLVGAWSSLDQP